MTTLVVDELKTTLSQTVNLLYDKRYNIAAIRPLILMFNEPAGTFTMSIKSGASTLGSKEFTSSDVKSDLSTTNPYAYLWKNLTFDVPVKLKKGTYTLELSSSGYTYSSSSFIGWAKEHENIFNEVSGTAFSDLNNPFSFQLFDHRRPESFL